MAGSAICFQKSCGFDEFEDVFLNPVPFQKKVQWLLLSGATDPPNNVQISNRKSRDRGSFLEGITSDFLNMERLPVVKKGLYNSVRNMKMTKNMALAEIKDFIRHCLLTNTMPVIYYTGHGESGTGNWCFIDDVISVEELNLAFDCQMIHRTPYFIISDCCYSGHWANYFMEIENPSSRMFGKCLAASPEFSPAFDSGKDGFYL